MSASIVFHRAEDDSSFMGWRRVPALCVALLLAVVAVNATQGPVGAQLIEPVPGEVIDRFRPPAHVGAPGNRGWEYATQPGTSVRAVDAGVVAFAGQVGGRLFVSIEHPDGLRTTYSFLASIGVVVGQPVAAGTPLGTSGAVFHFGARRRGSYLDPALLFEGRQYVALRLVRRTEAIPRRYRSAVPLGFLAGPLGPLR